MSSENFIHIISGAYSIGAKSDTITTVLRRLSDDTINKNYLYNSLPAHEISIEEISIHKRLVSVNEFERFISETEYKTDAEKEGWGWIWSKRWMKKEGVSWRFPFNDEADDIYRSNRELIPVLQTSWNDASAYTQWLSSKQKKLFRLPSEKEWEVFAAILGIQSMKDIKDRETSLIPDGKNQFVLEMLRLIELTPETYSPGLIWEWCGDWFDAYPGGIDNKEFGETYKVLRGGSLLSQSVQKTREYRFRRCPTARSPYYGFRVSAP